jgi:hypothetical protein
MSGAQLFTNVNGSDSYALQASIGAYSDEAYTNAKKLSGTGIVGNNPNIDVTTETFIGQMRWFKPLTPNIGVASLTNSAQGTGTTYQSDFATYIKTVRTHGATNVNMSQVVTQMDGLAKIGRDFGETRAQDEHNAILAVLQGVALSEVLYGAASAGGGSGNGGQTFTNDPTSKTYGFYVDMGNNSLIATPSVAVQGASRAESFLQALGMAWKDYEPEYCYVVVQPAVMASLRSANIVDQDRVQDGSIMFNTLFGGKFRVLQTRANQGFTASQLTGINLGAGVDIAGPQTSFIVLPGAVAMEGLDVPNPTEIFRDGRAFNGGGSTDVWYRWGYVAHPGGYDWIGASTVFPTNNDFSNAIFNGVTPGADIGTATGGTIGTATGSWNRKAQSALGLGILPVFHN